MPKPRSKRGRNLIIGLFPIIAMLALPPIALAAGDDAGLNVAGLFSWVMLGLAALVIGGVLTVLLIRRSSPRQTADSQAGPGSYVARMGLFSRNARLYVCHAAGLNVAFGMWGVLFNLYLLAVGFDIVFIGLYTLLDSATAAVTSIPAGLVSDRVGRKTAFLLGNGMNALASLIAVSTTSPLLILASAVVGGAFRPLFGTGESAFIAENSEDFERTHLFSVTSGASTAAGIVGSSLAGLVPVLLLGSVPSTLATISVYRVVIYVGLGSWFASLIPLMMLRHVEAPSAPTQLPPSSFAWSIFANVRHPDRIWRLTLPSVLVGLGAGFTVPLMNVFFQEALGGSETEIGATLSAGQVSLLIAAFVAPLAAARLGGKVRTVVLTRMLSIPFILLMAFSSDARVGSVVGSAFVVAALAHIARTGLMNMGWPLRAAFGMEILHPDERGTQVGIQQAIWGIAWGMSSYSGAHLMNNGDFRTPFLLMAGFYLVANLLFWAFFGRREHELTLAAQGTAT